MDLWLLFIRKPSTINILKDKVWYDLPQASEDFTSHICYSILFFMRELEKGRLGTQGRRNEAAAQRTKTHLTAGVSQRCPHFTCFVSLPAPPCLVLGTEMTGTSSPTVVAARPPLCAQRLPCARYWTRSTTCRLIWSFNHSALQMRNLSSGRLSKEVGAS